MMCSAFWDWSDEHQVFLIGPSNTGRNCVSDPLKNHGVHILNGSGCVSFILAVAVPYLVDGLLDG